MGADAALAGVAGRGKNLPQILLHALLLLAVIPRRGAAAAAGTCANGSVAAGCPIGGGGAGDEWQREAETSRRILAGYGGDGIVYQVLGKQACDNPQGTPYTQGHGCLSQRVNTGTRPCFAIYKCRS